jgi:hypothetical protein
MGWRNNAALILAAAAAILLIAVALMHLSDHSKDLGAVGASNLRPSLKGAVRALYFLAGCNWIAIAIILLVSAFTRTNLRSEIVLFFGFALLVNMVLMLVFMGWFIGTGMVLASALMVLCAGVLFQNAGS